MYEDKTSLNILQSLLAGIDSSYDKTTGSFVYDVVKPTSDELEALYIELDRLANKQDIDNLTGSELDVRVRQRSGLERKAASKASTTVRINGTAGSVISVGDVVASDTAKYIVKETKIVDSSGVVEVLVECELFGTVGNVPANSIKYFPVTLTGLISVTNPYVVSNGFDQETDEELRERHYEKIRTPATSGNKSHYRNWAKSQTGVGDAKVFPLWNGDNTVKVLIIDSNKQPADTTIVSDVQEYIDPNSSGLGNGAAPIGAFVTVESATSLNVEVSCTIISKAGYQITEIEENISQAIKSYLKEIAFVEDYISYAKIGSLILNSEGVEDYSDLTLNNDVVNISINDTEVAILGGVLIVE